jgi:ketosteroid isomerase-like protein
MSGTTAAIGIPGSQSGSGSVDVVDRQADGSWSGNSFGAGGSDVGARNSFGYAVAISGNRIVVGATGETASEGATYIFERTGPGAAWTKVAGAKRAGEAFGDFFGASVAVDGDRVLVGAPYHAVTGATRAAYVFERQSDGSWPAAGTRLVAPDTTASGDFGRSVSIAGDLALVGAGTSDAAYVFVRDATGAWTSEQKLVAMDGASGDEFGHAASLSGTRALVGAMYSGGVAGAAYVFERQAGGGWLQVAKLLGPPPNAGPGDEFGYSVSLSGDLALVGVPAENRSPGTGGLGGAGAAYVFQRQANGSWSAGVEVGSDPADVVAGRGFGVSVSISGPFAVIGAPTDFRSASAMVQSEAAYVADVRSLLP